MNQKPTHFTLLFFAFFLVATAAIAQRQLIGRLHNNSSVWAVKNNNSWGIAITNAGDASLQQPESVTIEYYADSEHIQQAIAGYNSVQKTAKGILAKAVVQINNLSFTVEDSWLMQADAIVINRKVLVDEGGKGGFLSGINLPTAFARSEADYFAPGMIYGSSAHLTPVAIGGAKASPVVHIREDRLPAPLFGIHFKDGTSIALLDAQPNGATTVEDSYDLQAKTLIDERFRFGAIGAEERQGKAALGFWFPGSEGGTTYKGHTYPGGQLQQWRRRYHPVKKGFVQQYRLAFRIGQQESFPQFYSSAWRWAWQIVQPKVNFQNIEQAQQSLTDMLAERVETHNGYTGITNWTPAAADEQPITDRKAIMGFTGKNLEAAEFLLLKKEAKTNLAAAHREAALSIFHSFTKLKMNPPVGEGFNLDTGEPALAIPQDKRVYLRSFGDDMKAMMRAYLREKKSGFAHTDWLQWTKSFADWLLTQQQPEGGFPRAWEPVTGKVMDASPQSSYTVIPFLLLMTEATRDSTYRQAAIKAGEFCWTSAGHTGIFVGGTIDNPDVIDKEAGTLSLEAYLALYKATHDVKWQQRATMAANYAETWMYIWNVPMPIDDNDPHLPWKKGVPTTGLQLISSGHSLADAYMAFDVDEYAHLYLLTKDKHYLDVARLLLHNTKSMLALPGRLYDLRGAGWMQEHWSLAPMRGHGIHRGWLPWVTTSQLNGIVGLKELDGALYKRLISKKESY